MEFLVIVLIFTLIALTMIVTVMIWQSLADQGVLPAIPKYWWEDWMR